MMIDDIVTLIATNFVNLQAPTSMHVSAKEQTAKENRSHGENVPNRK